jgi:hypothetical protein
MTVPLLVQDALAKNCGDRFTPGNEFGAIRNQLNYPCEVGLPASVIDAAATLLRSDPAIVQLLRLRAADVRSQIANLTFGNQDILDGLHLIAKEAP